MHRNAQQHSSDKTQPSADDYATINVQTQGNQPQYDVIQLDRRHGPRVTSSSDGYATLGTPTLGEQHQYEDFHPHQYEVMQQPNANERHNDYINVAA